jgi:hypothetical protein
MFPFPVPAPPPLPLSTSIMEGEGGAAPAYVDEPSLSPSTPTPAYADPASSPCPRPRPSLSLCPSPQRQHAHTCSSRTRARTRKLAKDCIPMRSSSNTAVNDGTRIPSYICSCRASMGQHGRGKGEPEYTHNVRLPYQSPLLWCRHIVGVNLGLERPKAPRRSSNTSQPSPPMSTHRTLAHRPSALQVQWSTVANHSTAATPFLRRCPAAAGATFSPSEAV